MCEYLSFVLVSGRKSAIEVLAAPSLTSHGSTWTYHNLLNQSDIMWIVEGEWRPTRSFQIGSLTSRKTHLPLELATLQIRQPMLSNGHSVAPEYVFRNGLYPEDTITVPDGLSESLGRKLEKVWRHPDKLAVSMIENFLLDNIVPIDGMRFYNTDKCTYRTYSRVVVRFLMSMWEFVLGRMSHSDNQATVSRVLKILEDSYEKLSSWDIADLLVRARLAEIYRVEHGDEHQNILKSLRRWQKFESKIKHSSSFFSWLCSLTFTIINQSSRYISALDNNYEIAAGDAAYMFRQLAKAHSYQIGDDNRHVIHPWPDCTTTLSYNTGDWRRMTLQHSDIPTYVFVENRFQKEMAETIRNEFGMKGRKEIVAI